MKHICVPNFRQIEVLELDFCPIQVNFRPILTLKVVIIP